MTALISKPRRYPCCRNLPAAAAAVRGDALFRRGFELGKGLGARSSQKRGCQTDFSFRLQRDCCRGVVAAA